MEQTSRPSLKMVTFDLDQALNVVRSFDTPSKHDKMPARADVGGYIDLSLKDAAAVLSMVASITTLRAEESRLVTVAEREGYLYAWDAFCPERGVTQL